VAVAVTNTDQGTTPPPANASASTPAIGNQGKGHTKASLVLGGGQNGATGSDAADAATDAQTNPATQPNNATGAASDSSGASKAKAADAANPDAQSQPDPASPAAASPDGLVATDASSGARTAAPSTSLSSGIADASNTENSANPAKSDIAGLPNFGFSAAATPTASNVAAAAPASPSTAAVPIAGLAVAIAARAQAGSNQFDIRLDPPELGRIDVHLDVDRDGQVTTHMTADRADTLQLLQSQQPQLERALEQAGLKTADNGLQFTLRDQSFAGQNNGSNPQQNNSAQLVVPDPDLPPVSATQIYSRIGRGSGVDIRV
jgi:flagellar hook-length control protein FliK